MSLFRFNILPFCREGIMRTNKQTLYNYIVLVNQKCTIFIHSSFVVIYSSVAIFKFKNSLNASKISLRGGDRRIQQKDKDFR